MRDAGKKLVVLHRHRGKRGHQNQCLTSNAGIDLIVESAQHLIPKAIEDSVAKVGFLFEELGGIARCDSSCPAYDGYERAVRRRGSQRLC